MTASKAQVRELDDRDASAIGAWIASGREGPAPDDSDAKSLTAAIKEFDDYDPRDQELGEASSLFA
jgi:hypothetical protein